MRRAKNPKIQKLGHDTDTRLPKSVLAGGAGAGGGNSQTNVSDASTAVFNGSSIQTGIHRVVSTSNLATGATPGPLTPCSTTTEQNQSQNGASVDTTDPGIEFLAWRTASLR
jgi:hypothetical protein